MEHRPRVFGELLELIKDGAGDGRDEKDLDNLEERELAEEGRPNRCLRDMTLHAGED